DQGGAEGADRLLDQLGPVVERHDPDARGKARLNLGDARLDGINQCLGVHARARHHDTADRLARALDQRGDPECIANLHSGDLLDVQRHAVRCPDYDPLDVVDGPDQSDAAYDQPCAVRLEHVAANVQIALANGADHGTQRPGGDAEPLRAHVGV